MPSFCVSLYTNRLVATVISLLLATAIAQPCRLCARNGDGTVPELLKSDHFLGLRYPLPLDTCGDLDSALSLTVLEGSEICESTKLLSSLCGCPVPEFGCTICGTNMTKPKQLLDGLVDLTGLPSTDYPQLPYTCDIVDSIMNTVQNNSSQCLDLPISEMQTYCGCYQQVEDPDNGCRFCPGGEQIPSEVLAGSVVDGQSCELLFDSSQQSQNGSGECKSVQEKSTACGCPVPENACTLCGTNGILNSPFAEIDYMGETMTCGGLEARLHRVDANSLECDQHVNASHRETCGCQIKEEILMCSLCPLGEPAPFPNRAIDGIKGHGFDYIEHSCGTFDALASVLSDGNIGCSSIRGFSKFCGCQVAEDACSVCPNESLLTRPNATYVWTHGDITSVFATPNQESTDGSTWDYSLAQTCSVGDSFLSQFDGNHHYCYYSQLLRSHACGCEEPSRVVVTLTWAQRISGILSLAGSLLIMLKMIRKKPQDRRSTYVQILFLISLFDSLSSLAYIFGTVLTQTEYGIYGAVGNDSTCKFQSWLFQIGITSVFYNCALCSYFLLVVKYRWSERKFQKIRYYAHALICFFGIGLACGVIPFAVPTWRWCYLSRPPDSSSWLPGIFFFILPVGLTILGMTGIMISFMQYIWRTEKKTRNKRLGGKVVSASMSRRAVWQSMWFLMVFYVVWPIQMVAFVVNLSASNNWIYVAAAIFGPLQGFLNACIVHWREGGKVRISGNMNTTISSAISAPLSSFMSRLRKDKSKRKSTLQEETCPEEGANEQTPCPPESQVLEEYGRQQDLPEASTTPSQAFNALTDESIYAHDFLKPSSGVDWEESSAVLECAIAAGFLTEEEKVIYADSLHNLQTSNRVAGSHEGMHYDSNTHAQGR